MEFSDLDQAPPEDEEPREDPLEYEGNEDPMDSGNEETVAESGGEHELDQVFMDFSESLSGDPKTMDTHSGKMTEYIRVIEKWNETSAEAPSIGLEVVVGPGESININGESVTFDTLRELAAKVPAEEHVQVARHTDGLFPRYREVEEELRKLGCGLAGDEPPWVKEAKKKFWNRAMKQLKTIARIYLRRFPPGTVTRDPLIGSIEKGSIGKDSEVLVNKVYKTLAKLLTGKARCGRVEDRVHFYRLAARNFRWTLLGIIRARKAGAEKLSADQMRRPETKPDEREAEHKRRRVVEDSLDDENFDPGKIKKSAYQPEGELLGNTFDAVPGSNPEAYASQNELFEKYLEVAEEMPEEILDVFDLHTIHGHSFEAIHEETGTPTSTLSDRYRRALDWLQNRLRPPEDLPSGQHPDS